MTGRLDVGREVGVFEYLDGLELRTNTFNHALGTRIPLVIGRLLTTVRDSFETRQNAMCLPLTIVCSTLRVNSGSDQGNWFRCDKKVRSWNSTGSDITSLSAITLKIKQTDKTTLSHQRRATALTQYGFLIQDILCIC